MTKTSSIVFWVSLTIFASAILYHTSYRVQDLSQQLRELNAQIEAERTNIHVLKAEWVYLANPAKIEQAARRHLAMKPTSIKQMVKLNDLMETLPTRTEAMANVTVESNPIATISDIKYPTTHKAPRMKTATVKDRSHINVSMIMQASAKKQAAPRTINEILLASDLESSGRRP